MSDRTDAIIASLKMARPPCPICQWPLWQTMIEPVGAYYERRTFLCPRCEYEDERDVAMVRSAA